MKKVSAALVCGIAAIAVTVLLYFTILNNVFLEAIHFICLVAIVLAEAITTGYACCVKASPRKLAATLVSSLMIPVSVLLSVVYIVNFPDGYATYICLYLVGTVLVNIFAYILLRFDASRNEENENLQGAKGNMRNLRKLVKCVMADAAAKPYEARLRALEENLHFSNDSVISAQDAEIHQMLLALQANIGDPAYDAQAQLEKLERAVQARKILTSRTV